MIDVMETAAAFFARRADGRAGSGPGAIPDKAPDRPPEAGDEPPKGRTPA